MVNLKELEIINSPDFFVGFFNKMIEVLVVTVPTPTPFQDIKMTLVNNKEVFFKYLSKHLVEKNSDVFTLRAKDVIRD